MRNAEEDASRLRSKFNNLEENSKRHDHNSHKKYEETSEQLKMSQKRMDDMLIHCKTADERVKTKTIHFFVNFKIYPETRKSG